MLNLETKGSQKKYRDGKKLDKTARKELKYIRRLRQSKFNRNGVWS